MTFRPRLRANVLVERIADGAAVTEPVLVRRVNLGPTGAQLVERLDGTLAAGDLDAEAASVLRRLMLVNLVEGSGDGIVARTARVLSGEQALDVVVLEGSRFQCQGSGGCCQNYVFGPLDDEDIERLRSLPIAAEFPHVEGDFIDEMTRESDGYVLRYLKAVGDERCVFLEDDARCGIHRRWGADAKPKMCRLYPLEQLVMLDGVRIFDKGSCATFAVSARSGPTIAEDMPRIRALLGQSPASLHHPIVHVDEYACDYGHYDRFAMAALGLVGRGIGTAAETLRAIGRGLRGFAQVLRDFPLEAGEPDGAVSRFLEKDAAGWYAGEPSEDEVHSGGYYYSHIFSALLMSAGHAIGEGVQKRGYLSLRLMRESAQLFHAASAASLLAVEKELAIDEYLDAVARVPVRELEVDEVLRLSLRQQLFGGGGLVNGHSLAGLLRIAFIHLLAVFGARLRAHEERRTEARAADLSWGHNIAVRILARLDAAPILITAEEHFSALLEALPAVMRLDYRRPMP